MRSTAIGYYMVVDPTVQLMERIFHEMRADRKVIEEARKAERQEMQAGRKKMRDLIQRLPPARLPSGMVAGGASGAATGYRGKKVEHPVLGPVQETDIADFRT